MKQSICIVGALLLTGCGGGSDAPVNGAAVCGFPSGTTVNTTIDPACAGCSATNAQRAGDNNFNTSATVVVTNNTTNNGVALRATAPAGTVFSSGTAGYWWNLTGLAAASWCTTIRTYLNNSLQESLSNTCGGASGNTGGSWGMGTTKQFDAVEVEITGSATVNVEEICSHM